MSSNIAEYEHPDMYDVENPDFETVYVDPLSLRYTFPQEIESLLEGAGLRVVERFGGPDRSPLTDQSDYLVFMRDPA